MNTPCNSPVYAGKALVVLGVFAFVCTFSAFAQTERGRYTVGGGFNASYTNNSTTPVLSGASSVSFLQKGWSVGINPGAGLFVADNILVSGFVRAGYVDYLTSVVDLVSSALPQQTYFQSPFVGVGIAGRYFSPDIMPSVKLFGEISVDYGMSWMKSNRLDVPGATVSESLSDNLRIAPGAGIVWFVTRTLGLEGMIYYENIRSNSGNPTSASQLKSGSTSDNIRMNVGVNFYLGN